MRLTRPTCYKNIHHESKIANLIHVSPSFFMESNEISYYLPIKEAVCEKLIFPERIDHNSTDSQENASVE